MYKTRKGFIADYGDTMDNLYFPYVEFVGAAGNIPPDDPDEVLMARYCAARALRTSNRGLPRYSDGSETFQSTDLRRPIMNACIHEKVLPFSHALGWIVSKAGYKPMMYPYYRSNWITRVSGLSYPKGYEADPYVRRRAYASMQPQFSSDFKILNALWELKDFRLVAANILKSLYSPRTFTELTNFSGEKCLTEVRDKFDSLLYYGGTNRDVGGRRFLTVSEAMDKAADASAGSWLLYKMAIIPTMKDIVNLTTALAMSYDEALKSFKEAGKTTQSSHYSEDLYFDDKQLSTSTSFPSGTIRRTKQVRFTATLQYRYDYTLSNSVEAFKKYWGLCGTAEEFWNMIPFSFLLDYIFKIGEALRFTEVDKNLDIQTVQYCESILSMDRHALCVQRNPATSWSVVVNNRILPVTSTNVPILGYTSSLYQRTKPDPVTNGLIVPRLRVPSTGQMMNVAALLKLIF